MGAGEVAPSTVAQDRSDGYAWVILKLVPVEPILMTRLYLMFKQFAFFAFLHVHVVILECLTMFLSQLIQLCLHAQLLCNHDATACSHTY